MCPNPQETADLVTFTEQTLNEKLHFLCSADVINYTKGPFMDVVDFIIKTPIMTHPGYWTIIKL